MSESSHHIRVANLTDAKAVSELLGASYTALLSAFYEENLLTQILPLITKANPLLLDSGTFYVAQIGRGKIVGCGGWSRKRPGAGALHSREGNIRHFATHPDWLRKGIGRDILLRCFEDVKGTEIKAMNCYSALGAETFYGAFGFSIVSQVDVPLTGQLAFPAFLMRNELT